MIFLGKNNYLQVIQYSDVESWSTYSLLGKGLEFSKNYYLERIGAFLIRNKTQVQVENGVLYKRPTIRTNGQGIRLRDEVDGKEIGTKNQFRIKQKQFLLSKIDARNGAFGVVPPELDNAIITGNFWTFDVNYDKINPHYLALVTMTKSFQKLSQEASVGTTNRNYLQETQFLNFKIPLPTLAEQKKIVDDYERKINEAKTLELNAENLESEIERYLFEELGVQLEQKSNNHKGLQFVNFTDIERWDILFLMGQVDQIGSKYKIKKFSQVITSFNKGQDGKSLRIDSSKFPQSDFRYIGMEHIEKKTGTLLELQNVKGGEIKSQTINVPRNFMIYGKLRPYLNKYWVNNSGFDNIICSSEFFVFDIDEEKLDKNFFKYVLASEIIQSQINDKTSGARMPRINEEIFFNLHFPIPEIQEQLKISQKISSMKTEIALSKEKAKDLRVSAEEEFEQTIFQ